MGTVLQAVAPDNTYDSVVLGLLAFGMLGALACVVVLSIACQSLRRRVARLEWRADVTGELVSRLIETQGSRSDGDA